LIKLHLHGRWVDAKQPVRPDAREPGAYETVTKGFHAAFAPFHSAMRAVEGAVKVCTHHTKQAADKTHEAAAEAKDAAINVTTHCNKLAGQAEENRKQLTGGK
jgi:hypothetical protein